MERKDGHIMPVRQLIINPGSTSTKLALYENETPVSQSSLDLDEETLSAPGGLYGQIGARLDSIRVFLKENDLTAADLDNIMCRGGMVWGLKTGGYRVNDELVKALSSEEYASPHASNLGGILGKLIADEAAAGKDSSARCPQAYIYDAVTAASLPKVARITGFPDIVRRSSCHVLNMHAMGEQYAADHGKKFEDLKLTVIHMGGGISAGAFEGGQIIDSIGDDDGPFSPERAGFTQILPIIKMCYSGKYTYDEMKAKVRGGGGLKAYLGTSDAREIEKMIEEGSEKARLLYEAQAYQIMKCIGELSVAHRGRCEAIILTGGLAYSKKLTDMIIEGAGWIAPICVYPGEHEMQALALGGLRIMSGEESAREFRLKDVAPEALF